MPHEIINYVVERCDDPEKNEILHHKDAVLVHGFMDWSESLKFGLGAIFPWQGAKKEQVGTEFSRTLFNLYILEVKRRGVAIDDKRMEDAFEEYWND